MQSDIANKRHGIPNVALRLLQRELVAHPGAPVHTARAFSECIVPTEKVLEVESPDAHVGRFTPDGRCLVCFSLQLQSVLLFDYLGPVPKPHPNPLEPVGFSRFFKERWRLPLCSGSELLNRDFCLSLRDGAFLLLASSISARREAVAQTAAATGRPGPTAAGDAVPIGQEIQQQQQQQQFDAGADDAHAAGQFDQAPANRRAASGDWCEMTTFHVVDVQRCMKVDERRFPSDYFELAGNGCVSLYDNTLALTSIYTQTIHLLQVNTDGSLLDLQSIGKTCQADDELPIHMAAAAEQQWQLQQQQRRQHEQRYKLQQQTALLNLPLLQQQQQQQHRAGQTQQGASTGSNNNMAVAVDPQGVPGAQQQQNLQRQQQQQLPSAQPQLQQLQQQHQQVSDPHSLWAQVAAAAIGAAGNSFNTAVGTAATPAAADAAAGGRASHNRGVQRGGDSDDSSDMERRERRRRIPTARQQQQQQQQRRPSQPQQPPPQQLQQQQQQPQPQLQLQQAVAPAPAVVRTSDAGPAAAGAAAAAATAAAAAAALLDPGGQLIEGLRQRLLAFLYKCLIKQQPCDVAPSFWDFQYNFGALSSLVIYRARLLDRQHLLLKLGAPTAAAVASTELSPSRAHFFALYDMASTLFEGFWKASDGKLLSAVMAQPAQLLAAGQDMSPWDRCSAGALYPAGYPVGLSQQQQNEQQQAEQQQQQRGSSSGSRQVSGRVSDALRAASVPQQQRQRQQQQQHQQHQQHQHTTTAVAAAPRLSSRSVGSASSAAAAPGSSEAPGVVAAAIAGAAAAATAGDGMVTLSAGASSSSSSGTNSSKAALERLKLLRQVVMLVLPGLQNLSSSPYLDPHLYVYSKHISPIMGLRNSPTEPLLFRHARCYPALSAPAAAGSKQHGGSDSALPQDGVQSQSPHGQRVIIKLEPAQPHSVVWGNEEVARRQLHLFHPIDPFVLTVVQTIAQPAAVSIYYRA